MESTEKSDDKKIIELEEREKILNSENKISPPPILEIENGIKLNKTDIKEGREVQPKKIPIGGIQMPGFFTRSKSKERCKDTENDQNSETEGAELLQTKEEDEFRGPQTRIKLPNPFRKSKLISDEEAEKITETKDKKKLLNTIRLPLVSVFPRKKKDDQISNQSTKAGLASIETLDETDKSADKKDEDLKNVCLDIHTDEKCELEKQSEEESAWKRKVRAYRIIINISARLNQRSWRRSLV